MACHRPIIDRHRLEYLLLRPPLSSSHRRLHSQAHCFSTTTVASSQTSLTNQNGELFERRAATKPCFIRSLMITSFSNFPMFHLHLVPNLSTIKSRRIDQVASAVCRSTVPLLQLLTFGPTCMTRRRPLKLYTLTSQTLVPTSRPISRTIHGIQYCTSWSLLPDQGFDIPPPPLLRTPLVSSLSHP